jgi:hypothetical protein
MTKLEVKAVESVVNIDNETVPFRSAVIECHVERWIGSFDCVYAFCPEDQCMLKREDSTREYCLKKEALNVV